MIFKLSDDYPLPAPGAGARAAPERNRRQLSRFRLQDLRWPLRAHDMVTKTSTMACSLLAKPKAASRLKVNLACLMCAYLLLR